MNKIIGSGGGKSGGGGGGLSEDPDTLSSVAFARFVDLIGEGEIYGLVHGDSSIYLDGVPARNVEGTQNYKQFLSRHTVGTQTQLPIPGFSGTMSETAVGLQIQVATGTITRSVPDADADSVRVTIAVNGFSQTDDKGKIGVTTIEYKISVRIVGGSWVTGFQGTLTGKTNSRYQRSHEINLAELGAGPYEVSVERITADSASLLLSNNLYWDSYAIINYEPFSYPNSALIAVEVDGRNFASVPSRMYHVRGLIVRVPSNYNPVTRVYTGIWDGTFVLAYTNNPAWCFYDLVTNKRYGLGRRVSEAQISKWVMYSIAKYCDEPVPTGVVGNVFGAAHNSSFTSNGDTTGGVPVRNVNLEPRFTLNCVINTKEDAYKVLNNLTSVFRGMSYWASGMLLMTQDRPTPVSMQWTNANVVDGMFTYEGSARTDRHTTVTVAWNDPAEDFKQRFEYVEDREGIARYGIRPMEMLAFGCTSQSQARRTGLWLLYTERIEKDAVKFRAGLDSANCMPGDVGKIMNNNRTGARWGGRVISATTAGVTLDAPVVLTAGTYTLSTMEIDGTVLEKGVNIAVGGTFTTLPVAIAYGTPPAAMSIWTLASTVVVPMLGRIIQVTPVGSAEFDIVCLEHNPSKYAAIELGAAFEQLNYSFLSFDKVPKVTNFNAIENSFKTSVSSVVTTNIEVGWDSLSDPLIRGYRLTMTSVGGTSVAFPEQRDAFRTIENALPGLYSFSVVAVNQLGIVGPAEVDTLTVVGVDLTPPVNVAAFVSTVIRDGVRFTWTPNDAVDYLETELHLESVWNDATLPIFVGRASTWTWASPPNGAYDVVAKHRDTSGNVSVTASHVNDTVPVYVPPADGQDGIAMQLSKWTHVVQGDSGGFVASYAGADTYVTMYGGGIEQTADWAFTKTDFNVLSTLVGNHVTVTQLGYLVGHGTSMVLNAENPSFTTQGEYSVYGISDYPVTNPGADVTISTAHAKFGNAIQFPGSPSTDNYISSPFGGKYAPQYSFSYTAQAQVYLEEITGTEQFLMGVWPNANPRKDCWQLLVDTSGRLVFQSRDHIDQSLVSVVGPALTVGVINQIGFEQSQTYPSTVKLTVNGVASTPVEIVEFNAVYVNAQPVIRTSSSTDWQYEAAYLAVEPSAVQHTGSLLDFNGFVPQITVSGDSMSSIQGYEVDPWLNDVGYSYVVLGDTTLAVGVSSYFECRMGTSGGDVNDIVFGLITDDDGDIDIQQPFGIPFGGTSTANWIRLDGTTRNSDGTTRSLGVTFAENDDIGILLTASGEVVYFQNGVELVQSPRDYVAGPVRFMSTVAVEEDIQFRIGQRQDGSLPFKGAIDELRLSYFNPRPTLPAQTAPFPVECGFSQAFEVNNSVDNGYVEVIANRTGYTERRVRFGITKARQGVQGVGGIAGLTGTNGTNGVNGTFFHVAYATLIDGSAGFNQTSGPFIGTYVDTTVADSTNYLDYNWMAFTGTEGLPGVDGTDGSTSYLHIKYSNDGGATFTASSGETPGTYLGTYVDFSVTDSTSVGAYTWALIKGADGADGSDGADGPRGTVNIVVALSGTAVWTDAAALAGLIAQGYGAPQTFDVVTEYKVSAGFSETRYYNLSGVWTVINQYLHGNLFVDDTIAASKIEALSITTREIVVGTATAASDGAFSSTNYNGSSVSTINSGFETVFSLLTTGSPVMIGGSLWLRATCTGAAHAMRFTLQIYADHNFIAYAAFVVEVPAMINASGNSSAFLQVPISNRKVGLSAATHSFDFAAQVDFYDNTGNLISPSPTTSQLTVVGSMHAQENKV